MKTGARSTLLGVSCRFDWRLIWLLSASRLASCSIHPQDSEVGSARQPEEHQCQKSTLENREITPGLDRPGVVLFS